MARVVVTPKIQTPVIIRIEPIETCRIFMQLKIVEKSGNYLISVSPYLNYFDDGLVYIVGIIYISF